MKKILFFLLYSLVVFAAALLFRHYQKSNIPPTAAVVYNTLPSQQLPNGNDPDTRVSPDGKTLAIYDDKKLVLRDMATSAQKEIPVEALSIAPEPNGPFLEGWSNDNSELWGVILMSESPNFFRVVAPDWKVEQYPLPHLPWGRDYALNPNTGLVAHSTAPLLLDTEDARKFEESQQRVILSVYDLFSKRQIFVAESVAKSFQPRWIDDGVLEYTDPKTESRIRNTYP